MNKKILVLGGKTTDYHNFDIMGPILEELLTNTGSDIELSQDLDILLPKNIKRFDIIVDYTTQRSISIDQQNGLLDAITGSPWGNTGGPKLYVGLHGATTSYQNSQQVLNMIGARFLTHPPLQEIKVKVEYPDHPLMKDVTDFTITDEIYLQEYYPPFETLLSTQYNGFKIPLAWYKSYGRGAVFYLSLGHGKKQLE